MRMALLLGVPAGLGLILLAGPLTATIFQYGEFTAFDTRMAAISLSAMAVGVPAFMLSKVLMPAFYARQDTKTPMRAALWTIGANVLLTVAITTPLWLRGTEGAHGGIALATGLAGVFNAWLLWRYLRSAGLHRPRPGWGVLALRGWIGDFRALATWWRVFWLLATVGAGVVAYAGALWLAGLRPADLRDH